MRLPHNIVRICSVAGNLGCRGDGCPNGFGRREVPSTNDRWRTCWRCVPPRYARGWPNYNSRRWLLHGCARRNNGEEFRTHCLRYGIRFIHKEPTARGHAHRSPWPRVGCGTWIRPGNARCLRDRFFGARIHAPAGTRAGPSKQKAASSRRILRRPICRSASIGQSAVRTRGPSHLRHNFWGGILRCVLCASCLPRVARALRSNQDFTFHHASEPRREELS